MAQSSLLVPSKPSCFCSMIGEQAQSTKKACLSTLRASLRGMLRWGRLVVAALAVWVAGVQRHRVRRRVYVRACACRMRVHGGVVFCTVLCKRTYRLSSSALLHMHLVQVTATQTEGSQTGLEALLYSALCQNMRGGYLSGRRVISQM